MADNPFTCTICLEHFDDVVRSPTTLPCGHSFCLSHFGDLKTCPSCRGPVPQFATLRPTYALREAAVLYFRGEKAPSYQEIPDVKAKAPSTENGAAAAAAAAAALPIWAKINVANTGRAYYFNRITKETTWNRPAEFNDPEENDSPDDWATAKDPVSGRTYFYHKRTRKTSWLAPASCVDQYNADASRWEIISDQGKPYYYNSTTYSTSWDKPAALVKQEALEKIVTHATNKDEDVTVKASSTSSSSKS